MVSAVALCNQRKEYMTPNLLIWDQMLSKVTFDSTEDIDLQFVLVNDGNPHETIPFISTETLALTYCSNKSAGCFVFSCPLFLFSLGFAINNDRLMYIMARHGCFLSTVNWYKVIKSQQWVSTDWNCLEFNPIELLLDDRQRLSVAGIFSLFFSVQARATNKILIDTGWFVAYKKVYNTAELKIPCDKLSEGSKFICFICISKCR